MATKPSEILQVLAGKMKPEESDIYQRFNKLLGWADKVRTLGIRANADQPDQAELAYAFGARGIGLCRTEHMFFGEGRIPIVQRMILADNETDRRAALDRAAAAAARATSTACSRRCTARRSPSARSIRRCTSSCRSART